MKTIFEFFKKHKIHILTIFVFLFFFKSCFKSNKVANLERKITKNEMIIDSLKEVILTQKDTINNISELLIQERLKVLREYDNYISSKDRGEQLMELHMITKNKIKDLEK